MATKSPLAQVMQQIEMGSVEDVTKVLAAFLKSKGFMTGGSEGSSGAAL